MARKRIVSNLHLLTVREVQSVGDGDHSDGGGLLLRVRGESASWVFRYTAQTGRRREMGLGVARRGSAAQAGDALTLARRLAHEARELLQRGVDPIDERDQRRSVAREAEQMQKTTKARDQMTLARAARDYHERVIEPARTEKHAAQWIASLEHHVARKIWHAPIDSITAPALLQALSGVRSLADASVKVPETLQRVRQRLDAVFEDAIFHGRCTSNPAAAARRKMQEAQPKRERGQFAALPYREAPAFLARLREQPGTAARSFELAVLTAARTSEVLEASWSEFDLDAATWTVPAERMKAGEAHVVYLSQRALDILHSMKRLQGTYVFPSPRLEDKPLSNMAMLGVLDRMGDRDRTTVHGLCRATFSTWAHEENAARPEVIEACLAHRESDRVKAAYNRAEFAEERRSLLRAWSKFLGSPLLRVVATEAKAA